MSTLDEKSIEAAARAMYRYHNLREASNDAWRLYESEARAAIAAYRDAEIADLRAKLEAAERVIGCIATLSHYGGLRNMSEREVLRDIRRLCLDRMVTSGSMEEHGVRLKAAIDAAREGERG